MTEERCGDPRLDGLLTAFVDALLRADDLVVAALEDLSAGEVVEVGGTPRPP